MGSDMGSDGKQQGLEALRAVHAVETDSGHGALSAYAHQRVVMGTMPRSG